MKIEETTKPSDFRDDFTGKPVRRFFIEYINRPFPFDKQERWHLLASMGMPYKGECHPCFAQLVCFDYSYVRLLDTADVAFYYGPAETVTEADVRRESDKTNAKMQELKQAIQNWKGTMQTGESTPMRETLLVRITDPMPGAGRYFGVAVKLDATGDFKDTDTPVIILNVNEIGGKTRHLKPDGHPNTFIGHVYQRMANGMPVVLIDGGQYAGCAA